MQFFVYVFKMIILKVWWFRTSLETKLWTSGSAGDTPRRFIALPDISAGRKWVQGLSSYANQMKARANSDGTLNITDKITLKKKLSEISSNEEQ